MAALKLRVLVADDSSAIQGFFADVAETSPIPFDVAKAVNGRQTIEFLNGGGINVAFIDVNMPEMSGMEAVGAARQVGLKTFVALMSAQTTERRLQIARQLKVYEYLSKPFTAADVHEVLRTYCRVTVPTKVLIVDDSATVRRIISKVLANSIFNIDVTEAGDGTTALRHCASGEFDAIFLDCNMPGLNGLETLEQMLEIDPAVKVIMNSSERNEDKTRWALQRGAVAFLHKPFYAADIDRELHGIFGLKLPMLAHADDEDAQAPQRQPA
jgi:CheY-like chemotaxis protein